MLKQGFSNNKKFVCEDCDYKCSSKKDYNKHLLTDKHKRLTRGNETNKSRVYACKCGKTYKHAPSLTKHRKTCVAIGVTIGVVLETPPTPDNDESDDSTQATDSENLVTILLQENKEMRETMMQQHNLIQNQQDKMIHQQEQHNKQLQELLPKLQQVTTINNTTNNNTTNNNKFNLNFFLNEQCKDAISIQTFMRDLNIGIKELEHMGNVGYLQGMISIMSNTLCAMDIYKRPVHCTDLKRETIYIKDGDTWKKDNANNDDLKKVIDDVADVNYRNLQLWEVQHPEAFECDTPDNIEYCKIALESLGGGNNNEEQAATKLNKIIKHVVREVYVK